MIIKISYTPGDFVYVHDQDFKARIDEICINGSFVPQYHAEWWEDKTKHSGWFHDRELKHYDESRKKEKKSMIIMER